MKQPSYAPWRDIAQLHADTFAPLLVAGAIVEQLRDSDRKGVRSKVLASPFEKEPYCVCGAEQFGQAQFWREGRLWRLTRCAESDCDHWGVASVPASDDLPEGAAVEGNSHWEFTPWMFLRGPETPEWDTHPVIADLAGALEQDGGWGLHEAIAEHLGAFVSEQHRTGCASRVGGVAQFIQWEHKPICATCNQAMPLLLQLGQDAGFHWGDAGHAYVFACPEHPEQHQVFQDTH